MREREIQAQRRKIIGEEKRLMEELKRHQEMEAMMEVLNRTKTDGQNADLQNSSNVTFDYEGKIMQVVRPNEQLFPDTLNNPKVRFK